MNYSDLFNPAEIEQISRQIHEVDKKAVEKTLSKQHHTLTDLPVLLSDAASEYLETMAGMSHKLTIQRFGKVMQLFIPMYLSNLCYNVCTYCGFSVKNKYKRIILTPKEIIHEAGLLKSKGFDHILLLTGEAQDKAGADYIASAVSLVSPYFSSVGIEVQPLEEEEYKLMISSGCDSLTLYQETYHPEYYGKYHLSGMKKRFFHRLDTPDKAGRAGIYKLNIGALFGLYDWRYDAVALAHHTHYLQKQYWQTRLSVSFPRINDAIGNFTPEFHLSDRHLVQLICAFRLIFPDVGITLSTRERPEFRNHLIRLGITTMSAESHTAPGGYSGKEGTEKQFETSDMRSLAEIKELLLKSGYEPVMKDWISV